MGSRWASAPSGWPGPGLTWLVLTVFFDPFVVLDVMKSMKEALDLFGLSPYLMAQPNGYRCPDAGTFGWCQIPEFPFAVEPRQITRWEARKWAREAYNIG